MPWPNFVTLNQGGYTLAPLTHKYHDDLVEATKDGDLWKLVYAAVPSPEGMQKEISRRLEQREKGIMLPFVVIDDRSKKAIGMTSYMWTDPVNRRLDIGFTWYGKSHQRTALNTTCKFLLLSHAFETLNCIAVGFRVDVRNLPSQKAVERIGAKKEGQIRNYAIMPDGSLRDMFFYSIITQEWAGVKKHLEELLSK